MNMVGKVGSLISQGVYSVATPFHPFGGAVDIIVVQHQDGTFRSTPWYVRFGKFQGVLKGAEKIVRINVNGIESEFHMHLDNSGEAFFLREANSSKTSEEEAVIEDLDNSNVTQEDSDRLQVNYNNPNERTSVVIDELETSLSDSVIMEFKDESGVDPLEQADSDEQSSHDGLLSEVSNSEVVLFSVDGHVLTAPLSSSEEENSENVKLCTPQFHLGPADDVDICENNNDFSTGKDSWAANYISDLDIPSVSCDADEHHLEILDGDKENVASSQEAQGVNNHESNMDNNLEDSSSIIMKEDVFKSCLELSELVTHNSPSPLNTDFPVNNNMLQDLNDENEMTVKYVVEENCIVSEGLSVSNTKTGLKDGCCETELGEPQSSTFSEGTQANVSLGFEISLCGNKISAGMGLEAASEAFDAHRILEEDFRLSAASILKNEDLIIRYRERYLRWDKAAPIILGVTAFGLDLPIDDKDRIAVEQVISGITIPSSRRRWRLWPIPFRRVNTLEDSNCNTSIDDAFVPSESNSQDAIEEPTIMPPSQRDSPRKQLIKVHNPTTEQIASLNLREGQNIITFSFSTRVLGTQQVDAHIYLWVWNTRIVISDVDGTITKSDVLGQFMPLVGRDWSQSGVAQLFSAIKENGYQLLFLSARAIVQAYLTRSFLLNLKQDGKALPNGPVVISPDGLFPSLYREVIRRAPHEFKIACLEDIKALFPADYNPFYAGFGNRDTDELSYRKIGIPKGKIFIINPKGEVAINHRNDVKSYTSLHTLVNDMFPPTSLVEQEDYNSWNFWRMPFPDIDI